MTLTKQQEINAMMAYNAYWDNYLKGDVEAMASLLSNKYTQVGSAETEVFFNKKDAVNFLYDTIDQVAEKLEMRNRSSRLEQQGNLVLVHELCDIYVLTDDKWVFYSKFRATTIMEDKKDGWKIIHQHSSFPDARTGEGENIAVDKIAEENRELREAVKRRTVELENKSRELEIETALEKVRSSALAMKQPADMLDVCHVIADQLQLLGVNNIRNVQTAIIHEQKSTYLNYQYFVAYNESVIEEAEYNKHPKAREMAETMKRSTNAFFSQSFDGEELNVFLQYRKQDNQFPDPILEESNSIHFYFYSIGPGALGISTYNSTLNESDMSLFKRFRNVFELAYRRFMDIQQAEAQTREAKIEAALEKVRAVAMSMNKADDLLNICEVLFAEFHKLGFDEMRNAMINIHNDEKETFINYDYSDEIGKSINHLTYNIHQVIEKQIKQIRSANDAFSETSFTGKDLEEWKKFRNKIGEKDDSRIDNISALYYYFYSIGTGSIGISTFSSINEEKLELLKRFRNVFSLAYQRYSDITLAEAQAREAKIEAALERVRSRTMAMQNSNELKDAAILLFQQIKTLGVETGSCGFNIWEKEDMSATVWVSSPEGGLQAPFKLPHAASFIYRRVFESMQKGEDFLVREVGGAELKKHFDYLLTVPVIGEIIKNLRETSYTFPKTIIYHFAFFKHGYLSFHLHEPCPEAWDIFKRFATVFEQTYTRFLDLQKAEVQAREAQIEAALERVRAKAMAMHNSNDLSDTMAVLFTELPKLGINSLRCGVVLLSRDSQRGVFYAAATTPESDSFTMIGAGDMAEHSVFMNQYESWLKNENYFTTLSNEELQSYYKALFARLSIPYKPKVHEVQTEHGYYFAFSAGMFYAWAEAPYSENEINILNRFKALIDLTFRRYLDLQKAEAQAREAQIELALERVRARTMAMHKSEELSETAHVLFQQFKEIDKEPKMLTIGIMNENEGLIEFWVTDWSGGGSKVDRKFNASIDEPILLNKIYTAWMERQKSIVIELSHEELLGWVKYRISLSGVPDKTEYSNSRGFVAAAFFSSGMLSISTYEPFSPETMLLLERFAGVFNLTYTRFLDLQKAEAQAREAQIEAALERVRSRTMGMQKSEELKDVIRVVYEQFVHLKINVDHAGFVVDYTRKGDWHFWIADEQEIPSKITHPYFDSVWANQFNEAKEKGADFFATKLNFEEKNKFYNELLSYVPGLPEASKDFYLSCPGLAATTVLFDNVSLYIENFSGIPYTEEENNTLMRFGKVFQQTYTRFLDLQKAETQAREANIETSLERVRSKAMAMHSPNDLSETVNVFFKELKTLGIIPIRCGVGQIDEATRTTSLTTTTSSQQGESFRVIGKVKQTGHPVLDGIFDHWKLQKEYHPVLHCEDIRAYYNVMNAQIGYPEYPKEVTQYGNNFFFKEGFVFAWTENLLSEEELIIFRRFTSVLSLTYRRYLDLKEAEEQAKEAKIEASLEKVRSKTMAMQSSEELADTAAVVFQQLINLGIEPNRIYITIIKDDTGTCEFWITDEDGSKVSSGFKANLNENHSFKKMYTGWKENKKSITIDMQGEELEEYFRHLSKLNVPFKDGLLQKRRIQYITYFSKGFIGVASPDETKPETIQLLERFAAVFNLTYTRFNDLKQAEAQNKIIQAENDRKTKELEEARQLQLSLLPRTLPQLSQFDIAVYMKTATEVGGDYYDFNVQPNGILNIGIGDATGHGLQAGTMITLMKGFFTADVAKFSPQKFLEHCNGIIRDIRLGRILMSFSHLRFENNRLLISSAGMPPVYYHHKKNNRTEEIIIQGLPLGAMGSASYKLVEIQLNSGDTILLLTDGLPEQMNNHKVIFDYSRVLKYFDEIAENAPSEIINRLVQKADDWMDGQKQSDDVTFVVIKVK